MNCNVRNSLMSMNEAISQFTQVRLKESMRPVTGAHDAQMTKGGRKNTCSMAICLTSCEVLRSNEPGGGVGLPRVYAHVQPAQPRVRFLLRDGRVRRCREVGCNQPLLLYVDDSGGEQQGPLHAGHRRWQRGHGIQPVAAVRGYGQIYR